MTWESVRSIAHCLEVLPSSPEPWWGHSVAPLGLALLVLCLGAWTLGIGKGGFSDSDLLKWLSDSENSSVLAIRCDIFESSKSHRFLGGAGHPFHGCIWLPARMDLVWSQRYSARYIRFCFGEPFQPLMPMDNLPWKPYLMIFKASY